MEINPIEVKGAWRRGWVLDLHTISSEHVGYDQQGNPQFDTKRSPLGEALYLLKYRQKEDQVKPVSRTMAKFLGTKVKALSRIDLIVSMPPSSERQFQPVEVVAKALGKLLRKQVNVNAVRKVRETPRLKNITDPEERQQVLEGAFNADTDIVKNKGILLIDDLFRSGATANAVTLSLIAAGAARVYLLAATRTRTHT